MTVNLIVSILALLANAGIFIIMCYLSGYWKGELRGIKDMTDYLKRSKDDR